jgi:RNA polymerase sigma factor FliA
VDYEDPSVEPSIRRIAWSVMRKAPYSVEIDDLIQVGRIGALLSLRAHPDIKDVRDGRYTSRVRGAMLDELRSYDPVFKLDRILIKRIAAWRVQFYRENGRPPNLLETTTKFSISEKKVQSLRLQENIHLSIVTRRDTVEDLDYAAEDTSVFANPYSMLLSNEEVAIFNSLLENTEMPSNVREVIAARVRGEPNSTVAERLGVTQSRVSQLIKQGVSLMRQKLLRSP